jgi:CPA1 family monovalent cation:H+ antiporter
VSLAAALAIPFATAGGEPFPQRALIIFLVYFVILVTLVGQGLMLPSVIRALGLAEAGRREREASRAAEARAWRQAVAAATDRLEQLAAERRLPDEIVQALRSHYRDRLRSAAQRGDQDDDGRRLIELSHETELLLIETERKVINGLYREGKLDDEARRHIERTLDLRAVDIAGQRSPE